MIWKEAKLNFITIMIAKLLLVYMSSARRLGRMDIGQDVARGQDETGSCCSCAGIVREKL